MKLGDKVRFISEKGGGIITGFQGNQTVLVEDEDGFEIPMLRSEVVVIDEQKEQIFRPKDEPQAEEDEAPELEPCDRPITFRAKPVERAGGNVLHVLLGIVPNLQHERLFDLYVVNDSNYQVSFQLLRQRGDAWVLAWQGQLQPNTKLLLQELDIDDVNDWEFLCAQLLASKAERPFALQPVVSTEVRFQPMRYYKESTFRPSPYFSLPAWVEDVCRG